MFRLFVIALLLACVAVACGNGKSKNQQHDDLKVAAVRAAHSAVFTLADLPPGWVKRDAVSASGANYGDVFQSCPDFTAEDATATKGIASATSDDFEAWTGTVSSAIDVFETSAKAQYAFLRLTAAFSNCERTIKGFGETAINKPGSTGTDPDRFRAEVTFADRYIPKLGDQSHGYRLEYVEQATGVRTAVEFQFIRVGRVNAMVSSVLVMPTDPAPGIESRLDDFPRLAEAKLRKADTSLP